MTILDTEPLDGVDYKNGVVGYITLVCILDFVFCFDVVFKANVSLGNSTNAYQERDYY